MSCLITFQVCVMGSSAGFLFPLGLHGCCLSFTQDYKKFQNLTGLLLSSIKQRLERYSKNIYLIWIEFSMVSQTFLFRSASSCHKAQKLHAWNWWTRTVLAFHHYPSGFSQSSVGQPASRKRRRWNREQHPIDKCQTATCTCQVPTSTQTTEEVRGEN